MTFFTRIQGLNSFFMMKTKMKLCNTNQFFFCDLWGIFQGKNNCVYAQLSVSISVCSPGFPQFLKRGGDAYFQLWSVSPIKMTHNFRILHINLSTLHIISLLLQRFSLRSELFPWEPCGGSGSQVCRAVLFSSNLANAAFLGFVKQPLLPGPACTVWDGTAPITHLKCCFCLIAELQSAFLMFVFSV